MDSELAELKPDESITLRLPFDKINPSSICQFRDVRLEALHRGMKVECWRDDETLAECMRITAEHVR